MKKILLVDDQVNFTKMLSIKMKSLGYEVWTAVNGQEALDIVLKERPDLVVMDIMMPVMDGFRAVENIRRNESIADTKVIFLSAKGREQDKERAKELKAVDFMEKPFSPKALIDKIESILI